MANDVIQFTMDEITRVKAVSICEELGIDLQTYLRLCMSRLIQENGIPFSMKIDEKTENSGYAAMKQATQIAEANGIADMTLEEINAEIKAARE